MSEGHIAIRRSPEMYLAAYGLSRATAPNGKPPPWLGVTAWHEAYALFFPSLGNGREERAFQNSLKNARDAFDGHFDNGRIGWRQSSKVERPPAPNQRVEELVADWASKSDDEVRDAVLGLIAGQSNDEVPASEPTFDPDDETDARRRVLAEVARRQGQRMFRAKLIKAYGGACAISGCDILPVLEAAHILPYTGPKRNAVSNGILLRADLHTLFDLRLIGVAPMTMTVEVAPELSGSEYGKLQNCPIRLPADPGMHPDKRALNKVRIGGGVEAPK